MSVLQEPMKQILKQKWQPHEMYSKSYKVIKSHIFHVRAWSYILHIFIWIQ